MGALTQYVQRSRLAAHTAAAAATEVLPAPPEATPAPAATNPLAPSSPSHLLSATDMEYTLADLDAIYTDQDAVGMPQMDTQEHLDDVLQPAEILQHDLFDFGDLKEDMPDFQCNFLDNLDEDMEDPDSVSSGHLVIDHRPQDNEPEPEPEPEPDIDSI